MQPSQGAARVRNRNESDCRYSGDEDPPPGRSVGKGWMFGLSWGFCWNSAGRAACFIRRHPDSDRGSKRLTLQRSECRYGATSSLNSAHACRATSTCAANCRKAWLL